MSDVNLMADELAMIRELIAAASPLPVGWGPVTGKTLDEHAQEYRELLAADTAVSGDVQCVYIEGGKRIICYTGNGPTSEANAKLIVFAFENLGKMVDEIERLREFEWMYKELSK